VFVEGGIGGFCDFFFTTIYVSSSELSIGLGLLRAASLSISTGLDGASLTGKGSGAGNAKSFY
jgi:hypothetical protein